MKLSTKFKTRLTNLGILISIILFFSSGPLVWGILIFSAIILFYVLSKKKNKYIKLQESLSTSKIKEVKPGLTEVEGKLIMLDPLVAPMDEKQCIGYRYKIEEVYSLEGEEKTRTIYEKNECNPFQIKDKTGQISVDPDGLEWLWMRESSHLQENRRFIQSTIEQGDRMLITGNAMLQGDKIVIARHPDKKVFAIAPSDSASIWNKNKALLNIFFVYLGLMFIAISGIYYSDIRVINQSVNSNLFQFHCPDLLQTIENNPLSVVFLAAFGIPVFALIHGFIRSFRGKKIEKLFYRSYVLTWMVCLFFTISLSIHDVPGFKLLLILICILIFILIFVLTNKTKLKQALN